MTPWSLKRSHTLLSLTLAGLLLVTGCSGTASKPATPPAATAPNGSSAPSATNTQPANPPATATATADTPTGVYPQDYRTQNPKLDAVIDGFMKKDIDRLMGMVEMTKGKCATGTELPCGDKPEGTELPYFFRATCATGLTPNLQLVREDMKSWVEESRRYFYAAYSVKDIGSRAYYVIFANGLNDNRAKNAYLNADGKIIALGLGCAVPTMPLSSGHYSPIVPPVAK